MDEFMSFESVPTSVSLERLYHSTIAPGHVETVSLHGRVLNPIPQNAVVIDTHSAFCSLLSSGVFGRVLGGAPLRIQRKTT